MKKSIPKSEVKIKKLFEKLLIGKQKKIKGIYDNYYVIKGKKYYTKNVDNYEVVYDAKGKKLGEFS